MHWEDVVTEARSRGDLVAMEQALINAVHHVPEDFRPALQLSEVWLATGRAQDAISLLEGTAGRHRVATIHTTLALVRITAGTPEGAERDLERAIGLEPTNGDAHALLGELLLDARRPAEAATILERAVRLRPEDAAGWANLGLARMRTGQPAAALAAWQQARPRMDDPSPLDGLEAEALGQLGRHEDAIQSLLQALGARPDDAELWAELGHSLGRADRWNEAVPAYLQSLQRRPAHVGTRLSLATTLDKVGHPEDALSLAAGVYNAPGVSVEDRAWAIDLVGIARLSMQDAVGAATAFEEACQLAPSVGRYHAHFAAALLPRRPAEAITSLPQSLLRDP